MTRKIIPVQPDREGRIISRAPVHEVFDTNGAGELLPVEYHQSLDALEVRLTVTPYSQVYVEIHE